LSEINQAVSKEVVGGGVLWRVLGCLQWVRLLGFCAVGQGVFSFKRWGTHSTRM